VSWLRVRAIARRNTLAVLRAPQRWFDVLVWPLVDAVLFGSIAVAFGETGAADDVALGFFLSAVLLFHVVFQSQVGLAVGFMEETWSRNLLNLLVTPLRETEYVAGVLVFALAKVAIGITVVAIVAALAFTTSVGALGFALIPMVAVLFVVGTSVGLLVIGMILRFGQGAEILTWGFLAIWLPLSGIFYPVDALPALLQPVSQLLPTTHVFAAARTVVDGGALPWSELGWASLGAVVLLVGSAAFVVKMLAVFRARGYVSRHT